MILDTNILLRLIDGPDHPQHDVITQRLSEALASGERLRVDAATVHEVVFVLASKATGYGYSRTEIAGEVHALVEAAETDVEHALELRRAATDFGASRGVDFHDCYLAARARELGESVFSLDRDFERLD